MAIVDWRCTPNIAINDPMLMVGMPPSLTAATGMDALPHAVEAYAEYLAGMAFNNASLGYVHAMAHQLGGFYNLPH